MVYTIKKGKHDSRFSFIPHLFRTTMTRLVTFTDSCRYDLKDIDQFDINKLYGFSQLYHHHNSARFGWRYNIDLDQIEIFAYCYVAGERVDQFICVLEIGETYLFSIKVFPEYYSFRVRIGEHTNEVKIIKNPNAINIGYLLEPYFGGNKPAPHKMQIIIDRLNS